MNILKIKLILLGEKNVGKTTIIAQYTNKKIPEEYIMTISNEMAQKNIHINENIYSLEIWEISGVEKNGYNTHILFKNANIALLIYDITNKESYNALNYWYNKICDVNGKNHIFFAVISNKNDLYLKQQVSNNDGKNFSKLINGSYYRINAKYFDNVEKMFSSIIREFVSSNLGKELMNTIKERNFKKSEEKQSSNDDDDIYDENLSKEEKKN